MTSNLQASVDRAPTEIHAGFIPLTDCAPLVVAKELGFDAAHGIRLQLHKEISWANIRDKAEAGLLDCAIMLAPMPLASTLGLGGRPPVPMIAAMATSLNGNAITVSRALYEDMTEADPANASAGGIASAISLARVVEKRRAAGEEALTLGMVYPFSSHNYDLRYWLASAGVDPDNDINLVVVPPPLIAGSLKSGRIDGFCVGEPWNSVAVCEGSGVIVATKAELWAASPEKVLGMRADFANNNPDDVQRLIGALSDACAWLDDPTNRPVAAEILSRIDYVGIPLDILYMALSNTLMRPAEHRSSDTIIFSKNGANFPWVSHATWMLTQIIRWGQMRAPFDITAVARAVYRADLYGAAMSGKTNATAHSSDSKTEGDGMFFGNDVFDPNEPIAYLQTLPMRDMRVDLAAFNAARS